MRLFLAALLAAAIPLQGVAAATMTLCAPGSALGAAVAAAPAHGMSHHHGVDHADHAMHRQHVAASSAQGELSAADAAQPAREKRAKAQCSVCASCLASAALPAAAVVFDAFAPTEGFAATVSVGLPAFLTAGLERPPRPLLA